MNFDCNYRSSHVAAMPTAVRGAQPAVLPCPHMPSELSDTHRPPPLARGR